MFSKDHGNIILHQILYEENKSIKEFIPTLIDSSYNQFLTIFNNKITWEQFHLKEGNNISITNNNGLITIDASLDNNIIINNKLKDTNLFYDNGRFGLGRPPLYKYKFDIAVSENTLMTAFHIGDGTFGFSLGNGTNQGFIPEIIGMGSDENDAGLYLIGRAGNNIESDIPLIIIDGRNNKGDYLKNRPILGITSADYNKYKFLINNDGFVEIDGKIKALDFILDSSISLNDLKELIIEQNDQINLLKDKLNKLESKIK